MSQRRLTAAVLGCAALAAAAAGSGGASGRVSASRAKRASASLPHVAGCQVLPADNPWNQRVDRLPVANNSAQLIARIGLGAPVHPDFGTTYAGAPNGIPFTVVGAGTRRVPVRFHYASESDPGPYPIPPTAPIEGGPNATGDRHVIVVDSSTCTDYELFGAYPRNGGSRLPAARRPASPCRLARESSSCLPAARRPASPCRLARESSSCLPAARHPASPCRLARESSSCWTAGSGAIFHLGSDHLRPAGWTSADAAGLPILPGLARYSEVAAGAIDHALRFTSPCTGPHYVYPARHQAPSCSPCTRHPASFKRTAHESSGCSPCTRHPASFKRTAHESSSCSGSSAPPMGLRVRLKASVDISHLPYQARVVAVALKRYGLMLADNGSPWYISGAPDRRWNDSALHELDRLSGSDFQVVDTSSLPHPH